MKRIRLLVMCLLALAIPLQGMAAVSQMFCHGSAFVSAAHNDEAHLHDHPVAQYHHDSAEVSAHHVAKVDTSDSLNHKCSTCAQCCFGVAMLPASIHLSLPQAASTFVAISTVLLGEFSPLNLDRPPRSFLA